MSRNFVPPPEPRPRDFALRYRRGRAPSLAAAKRKRRSGKEFLVLAGAVALPAFAAPGEWGAFEIGDAGRADVSLEPMPFEMAGSSFPGSAFYYLAAEGREPAFGEGIHSDADGPATAAGPAMGPAASAIRIDNSGVDRTRALQCLTAAIYYEAASEPDAGQRAVAQVVLNRVAHPSYPGTVCGVVYQGSERRTGCQFSFTCDGSLARRPMKMFWERAQNVAIAALSGYVYTPVGLATHYHTIQIHPYWADSLAQVGTIGAHRFYRFRGKAGQAATFRFAYLGGEPLAAPHPRSDAASRQPDPVLDPVAVQKAYDTGFRQAQQTAASHPTYAAPIYAPDVRQRGGEALYSGTRLPEATGVKPEYQNSGRWIAQPGT